MQISPFILIITFLFAMNTGVCQSTVFATDFESGIPSACTIVDNDGLVPNSATSEYTSAWISVMDPDDELNMVAGSTSYFEPAGTASRWLITPELTLGSFGNFLSWKSKSHDASFPDDYLVLVSNTDTELSSFTDTIGNVMEENADWTFRSVDLSSEGYNDQTIFIAFVNVTVDGFKLYLDSLNIWKEDPVGAIENQNIKLKAHPNPFVNTIIIESGEELLSIRLTDSAGRTILETNEHIVNTENFPSGMYLLTVRTNSGLSTKRLIKP